MASHDRSPGLNSFTHLKWSLDAAPSHSSVDIAHAKGWVVSRIRSTAGVLRSKKLPEQTVRAIFSVEGGANVTTGGRSYDLRPRQGVLLRGADLVVVRNQDLWSRFDWIVAGQAGIDELAQPFSLSEGYLQLIGAVTETLAKHRDIASTRGASIMVDSLSSIVAAARISAEGLPVSMSAYRREQYRKAMDLVNQHHVDPHFNVAELSEKMAVSVSTLHAIFTAAEATPRQVIEARRVRTAIRNMRMSPKPDKPTVETIAESSGFTSPKKMRSALGRFYRSL